MVGRFLHSRLRNRFSDQPRPFKRTHQWGLSEGTAAVSRLFLCLRLGGRTSNDCSIACQQSNFPLPDPIFYFQLFTCVHSTSSHFSPLLQICTLQLVYLLPGILPEVFAFILLCNCCIRCCRGWSAESRKWLSMQKEISFAQQIHTASGYKLSGSESECACECVCTLMSVVVCLRREMGAVVCVCVCACIYWRVCWWKEASTPCAAGCYFPPASLLPFVCGLVTMSGGERAALPMQHHSSHMSNC